MDIVVQVAAWISVVLVGIVLIGQLSVPDTRDGAVGRRLRGLLGIALNALMAGRVLGWW